MNGYIFKENAIEALNIFNDEQHANKHFMNGIESAKEIIENLTPEDVIPVVHSMWSWHSGDKYRCVNCGRKTHVDEIMDEPQYVYCPYCGARMDG